MENKVRIKGGDTVQLKSGEIVKVVDKNWIGVMTNETIKYIRLYV
jgi:hypothetical protein